MPKTHVYRVIRSGEVRVNKGRASVPIPSWLALGDEVRIPPVRVAEKVDARLQACRRASSRSVFEDDALLVAIDKPAGRRRCTAAAA